MVARGVCPDAQHVQAVLELRGHAALAMPKVDAILEAYRAAFAAMVHGAEIVLRLGVTLRCSEPKQPPRLGKVNRAALASVVHEAEAQCALGLMHRGGEGGPKDLAQARGLFLLAAAQGISEAQEALNKLDRSTLP